LVTSTRSTNYWLGLPRASYVCVTRSDVVAESAGGVSRIAVASSAGRIGVESGLDAARLLEWQRELPGLTAEAWLPITGALRRIRATKDNLEQVLLRHASEVTCGAVAEAVRALRPGCTEADVLSWYQCGLLDRHGGLVGRDDVTVLTGSRTTRTWGGVTTRAVQLGEPVTIDVGTAVRGYWSDVARSVVLVDSRRAVPPGWRKAFDAVRAALGRVCHDCRPGATAGSLATACEAELERRGFAGSMPHHLGHGIGLESHELPLVTVDSATILEPGMVIAVEPAVVIPDLLGVRIEETLLVTEDGCRIISQPSQEELSPDGVVVV